MHKLCEAVDRLSGENAAAAAAAAATAAAAAAAAAAAVPVAMTAAAATAAAHLWGRNHSTNWRSSLKLLCSLYGTWEDEGERRTRGHGLQIACALMLAGVTVSGSQDRFEEGSMACAQAGRSAQQHGMPCPTVRLESTQLKPAVAFHDPHALINPSCTRVPGPYCPTLPAGLNTCIQYKR